MAISTVRFKRLVGLTLISNLEPQQGQGQQGVGNGLSPGVPPAGDSQGYYPSPAVMARLPLQITGWAAGDVMLVPMTELPTVAFPALQHSAPRRDGDKRHPAE